MVFLLYVTLCPPSFEKYLDGEVKLLCLVCVPGV